MIRWLGKGRNFRGERMGKTIGGDKVARTVNRAVRQTDGETKSGECRGFLVN